MMIICDEDVENAIISEIMNIRDLEDKYSKARTDRWRTTLDGRIARAQMDIGYQIHYAFIADRIECK